MPVESPTPLPTDSDEDGARCGEEKRMEDRRRIRGRETETLTLLLQPAPRLNI